MIAEATARKDTMVVFSKDPLPATGTHYVEITLEGGAGPFFPNHCFVGVTALRPGSANTSKRLSKRPASYGFRDDSDDDALRVDGRGRGSIRPLNGDGRTYSLGETLGLLIDMDAGSITLYWRDGVLLEGVVSTGFKGATVWFGASVCGGIGCQAKLAFPNRPLYPTKETWNAKRHGAGTKVMRKNDPRRVGMAMSDGTGSHVTVKFEERQRNVRPEDLWVRFSMEAVAAREQIGAVTAVSIDGHPAPICNGVYRQDPQHKDRDW